MTHYDKKNHKPITSRKQLFVHDSIWQDNLKLHQVVIDDNWQGKTS